MGKRVAIVGTRFTEIHSSKWVERIRAFIDTLPSSTEVIVNGAPGTDRAAAEYAKSKGLKVRLLYPDIEYPKDDHKFFIHKATAVVQEADELHAFWDGQSHGTQHAITVAKHLNVPVYVHLVHDEEWQMIK